MTVQTTNVLEDVSSEDLEVQKMLKDLADYYSQGNIKSFLLETITSRYINLRMQLAEDSFYEIE